MSIALTEEHRELGRVARSFLEAHEARAESRATIGGGTSKILRNQIAERLLGLPRDPLIQ
jgi:alkylation response protein AidB-like acyl-CoA dehydrogenase